ncbi:RHS repeat domain-containing protein [Tahibacter aquaticus]|uniref:RHS repeat domain-containing protein n=1 Tax=Tahibacter aquaticus TaxID=520092 RepID=UPI00105FF6C5|nr:RHS repeat-associated core domain-containing protein [Tahibacter aquaticus]
MVSYGCDANGNVISGSALTISFDVDNKPRSVMRSASGSVGVPGNDLIFRNGFQLGSAIDSAPSNTGSRQTVAVTPEGGDGSMSYAYDSNGMRYAETVIGGATTRYGPRGYEKIIGGSTVHRHELGPVTVSRSGSTDTVSYLLRDRLGSTIAVTNTSGALSERRQFDAFGKARNADFSDRPNGQANLVATNHGFTGHTQADEVWLIHMNGRLYDQNLGRFLGVDPIIENPGSQALNPYSYLQNNPLSGTDPSGYAKASEECAGAGRAGCVGDQEVKATKAATMTGSHIAGVNTGASVTLVNPTPGGMAELQVAAAGMSSGYVVQADAVSAGSAPIADKGSIGTASALPQDRPGKDESGEQTKVTVGSGGATAPAPPNAAAADQFLLNESANAGQPFCSSNCEATPHAAHAAAGERYLGASIAARRESGWNVYQLSDKAFTFTFPRVSSAGVPEVALPGKLPSLVFDSSGHTHWDSNHMFSPKDWTVIVAHQLRIPPRTLYVATGDGNLRYANPAYAKPLGVRIGARIAPPSQNFPGQVVPGVTIKTTYP